MGYIIVTYEDGKPFGVTACAKTTRFKLIPINSDVALTKVYCHPYRAGASAILAWIKQNDEELSTKEFEIFDSAKFQR